MMPRKKRIALAIAIPSIIVIIIIITGKLFSLPYLYLNIIFSKFIKRYFLNILEKILKT